MATVTVTKDDLVAGFRRIGIEPGDRLEVHSSLSSFGYVDGGADALIGALIESVGPGGAVVMPAAQASRLVPLTDAEKRRGLTWKLRVLDQDDLGTPTFQGHVVDRFRSWPGIVRGSYAAWGAGAADYAGGLAPFVAAGGRTLLLGVGLDRASCLHVGDPLAPLPADIAAVINPPPEVLADYEGYWIGYDARCPGDEIPHPHTRLLTEEAERCGLITRDRIGGAEVLLFEARPVVELSVRMRRERPYEMAGFEPPVNDPELPDRSHPPDRNSA